MASEEKCGMLHGKYELGRLLGHDTFAKVYLARNLQTNSSVVMKVVAKEKVIRVGMMEQVKREISVMKMVHHPNIVSLYKKIYRGDFKCPPWLSPDSRKLISRMLELNPSARISIAKIMSSSWFKKSMPMPKENQEEQEEMEKGKETETLKAFHIISLSEGFNMSPLFEEKKKAEKDELRFATTRPVSSVISRIEELGRTKNFSVKKSGSSLRLQGQQSGRKGRLGIAAEMFAVTPSLMVVEVKKQTIMNKR